MTKVILASQSLGRHKMLSYLKIAFQTIPSKIKEEKINSRDPLDTIILRARAKAEDIAEHLTKKTSHASSVDYLTISADSGAIIDNTLIGKPRNKKEAVKIFHKLSNRTHRFNTAVYIIKIYKKGSNNVKTEVLLNRFSTSFVTFRKLKKEDIELYLSLTEYTRYAAGYRLIGAQDFIAAVDGSISNVIGLPLELIIPVLRSQKIL